MDEPTLLREVDQAIDSNASFEATRARLFGMVSDRNTLVMLAEALVLKAFVQGRLLKHLRGSAEAAR